MVKSIKSKVTYKYKRTSSSASSLSSRYVKRIKRKPKRQYPEAIIQKKFISWLTKVWKPRGMWWCHPCGNVTVGNQQKSSQKQKAKRIGKQNKDMGYWAGTPDLIMANAGKTLFIEFKSSTGSLQKNQKATISRLSKNNFDVVVARSVEEAKRYTNQKFQ